jgi:heme exporter protein A
MTNNDHNQTARKPALSTADNRLHINQLSVVRGMVLVISNLSHQQVAGDICCLTGPNGAGKSTLLRTIAGRLPARGGDINCAAPIIYVGHTDGLSGAISGRENLAGWAKINGISATENAIDTALSNFATNRFADLPVRVLSRGQRRRLALARLALAPADTLWLLDEPNAGLDQASSRILDEIVQKHATAGGMVLAATHLDFAAAAKPRSLHLPGLVT